MLVVDASAITELLLGRSAANAVARELRAHEFDAHAPNLLDIEVLDHPASDKAPATAAAPCP